ncbi:MAG: DNA repair protein RecN [Acidobacteria bacterium]|nr:DNA repair protein RecN [Acidobacteriota bacterium]
MLRYLNIRNLAVIESLEVTLQPGLNVMTGETGAGKSIVVGAVGLLLGDRASADVIRTGEEIAIIQAVFEHSGREVIVRREVNAQGRSRSFVDGVLVTASALKELGATLVDLHGQHEHQALLDPDVHLDLLDRYAGLASEREAVRQAFDEWTAAGTQLEQLRRVERDKEARAEFLRFQLSEIDRVKPVIGEDEELETSKRLLANAEKLKRLCDETYLRLYDDDLSVVTSIAVVWKRVGELAQFDPRFQPFLDSRDAIDAQLDELAGFVREYGAHIDASPDRLGEVEDRLAALERLKRKYGPTVGEVVARQTQCAQELTMLESAAEQVQRLEGRLDSAANAYRALAESLSRARRARAAAFASALEKELAELAMECARFEVRFEPPDPTDDGWTARGIDQAQFFVSPNPGEELRPLARIASGGELSRMMLALKTLASTDSPGKTLIFDEVDAGIGGRVADVVGQRLQSLGREFQVLCITHLPQIAAAGGSHYRVAKLVRQGRTVTSIEHLGEEARVDELARMMAGAVVTDGARSAAREMIAARGGESERGAKGERRKRK